METGAISAVTLAEPADGWYPSDPVGADERLPLLTRGSADFAHLHPAVSVIVVPPDPATGS